MEEKRGRGTTAQEWEGGQRGKKIHSIYVAFISEDPP